MNPDTNLDDEMRKLMDTLLILPQIKGFMNEWNRRESLPRKTCNKCWFEYSVEDPTHKCPPEF